MNIAAAPAKFGARLGQKIYSAPVPSLVFFLYLVFTLDFFVRVSARIPGVSQIRPTLLLVGLISLLLLFNLGRLKEKLQSPTAKALGILLLYIFITMPLVKWPGSALRDNSQEFIKAFVFFYFTLLIVDTDKRLKWFLIFFLGTQLFRVLEPLYLNITQGYWGSSTFMGGASQYRLAGAPHDVINSNELGFVIATLVPFLHYLLIKKGWLLKLIYFALLGVLLWALVLTMSRGAFIALLVVLWFIFKQSSKKPLLIAIGFVVAVAGWSQMSDVQKDRYLSLTGADVRGSGSASGRLSGIVDELKLAMDYPLFGHGVGTTNEAKYHKFGRAQASHSLYAELVIEIGIVGFILFMRFLHSIYMNFKRLQEQTEKIVEDEALAEKLAFETDLSNAMRACFWMYVVYSINYWGLSVYYWYLFGGLCAAMMLLTERKLERIKQEDDGEPESVKGTL
ncbi:O-antigen ligase family protein [Corallincola platygyrae]|uniref:O-antigen ligase family protein n=1 Tax=Corallincola platygyrae TaxID=1193278 RepID=A0ABW4XPL6_9GAMM